MEANDKDMQVKLNDKTNQLFKMKQQLSFSSKLKKGGNKDGRKSFKCGNPTCLFKNGKSGGTISNSSSGGGKDNES